MRNSRLDLGAENERLRRRQRLVSGTRWSLFLGACLGVSALLVPWSLRLARWAEWELVLVCWWAFGAAVLARLLYRGWGVSDDHRYGNLGLLGGKKASGAFAEPADLLPRAGHGCADWIVSVLAIVVLLLMAAFVIDFVMPALFFVVYQLLRGALARVANDQHDCEGNVARALRWGALWAAIYTLPLGAIVWMIHRLAGRAV